MLKLADALVLPITLKQRFDVSFGKNNVTYAPLSWGCPSMLIAVDRSVFKKTEQELGKLFTLKSKLPKTKKCKFKTFFHGSF